jgi:hypothetical protein
MVIFCFTTPQFCLEVSGGGGMGYEYANRQPLTDLDFASSFGRKSRETV